MTSAAKWHFRASNGTWPNDSHKRERRWIDTAINPTYLQQIWTAKKLWSGHRDSCHAKRESSKQLLSKGSGQKSKKSNKFMKIYSSFGSLDESGFRKSAKTGVFEAVYSEPEQTEMLQRRDGRPRCPSSDEIPTSDRVGLPYLPTTWKS